jgi:hypothetical protein
MVDRNKNGVHFIFILIIATTARFDIAIIDPVRYLSVCPRSCFFLCLFRPPSRSFSFINKFLALLHCFLINFAWSLLSFSSFSSPVSLSALLFSSTTNLFTSSVTRTRPAQRTTSHVVFIVRPVHQTILLCLHFFFSSSIDLHYDHYSSASLVLSSKIKLIHTSSSSSSHHYY